MLLYEKVITMICNAFLYKKIPATRKYVQEITRGKHKEIKAVLKVKIGFEWLFLCML